MMKPLLMTMSNIIKLLNDHGKRQAIQLLFDSDNFPAIPGATPTTQATPSTVAQAVPTTTQVDVKQKLASIENKLQTQITSLQEQQDDAHMKNILKKFEENVWTMMTSIKYHDGEHH
eukprot:scaffold9520_cov45-Attheya_sp.AAC.2